MAAEIQGIYIGARDKTFKKFIKKIIKLNQTADPEQISTLLSVESLEKYGDAFTHEDIDEKYNYQVYEQLGDLSGNKFIVWYIYKRFPQLRCTKGVKVAARVRINYGSKQSFSKIADKLGFWDFITATNDLRVRKKESLLEDTFEAFIGVTESILDNKYSVGVGYAFVYNILNTIFDGMDISLKYEDLYDAKTRLKELFDIPQVLNDLGPILYSEQTSEDDDLVYSKVLRCDNGMYAEKPDGSVNLKKIVPKDSRGYRKIEIGHGSGATKSEAQQNAAEDAIQNLKKQGYYKRPPSIYRQFAEGIDEKKETTKEDILKIIGSKENINEQFSTREKSKYQSKYTSTVLSMYCSLRDLKGVKYTLLLNIDDIDPNIKDSEGMYPLDRLLIGRYDPEIYKIIKKLLLLETKLRIHRSVYDAYYKPYLQDEKYGAKFQKYQKQIKIKKG